MPPRPGLRPGLPTPPPPQKPKRTTLKGLVWLMVSAAALIGACVLPMARQKGSPWHVGQSLSIFGPHLLGDQAEAGTAIFVTVYVTTIALAVACLAAAARLVGRLLAVVMAIAAFLDFLFSLLLLAAMHIATNETSEMVVGLGSWLLPVGTFLCFLTCVVPGVRDGWMRQSTL